MTSSDEFGANDWLIDEMRERYENDPDSVSSEWARYFSYSEGAQGHGTPGRHEAATPPAMSRPAKKKTPSVAKTKPVPTVERETTRTESPNQPGRQSNLGPEVPDPKVRPESPYSEPTEVTLRGAAMRTARNMDASLSMPVATSVRSVPMKLVIENRATINNFLRRSRGGKVSFTHIIAFAMVQALKAVPAMNNSYAEIKGKPTLIENPHINLGIAVDVVKRDKRQLLVPNVRACETLNFAQFYAAYEELIAKARDNKLTVDDFANTTCTITNPGGIGTNMSVPRLMNGQGTILGVGSINYTAEFEGSSQINITEMGVGKVTTLTSTYDHRVIQGAQSGEFLREIHRLLMGANGFYESIFESLRIPYPPTAWDTDKRFIRDHEVGKQARVISLIRSYRLFGHLQADTDPVEYKMRTHPDLELAAHGLTLWDLDREFPVENFAGQKNQYISLREIMDVLRDSYCHTMGIEYMYLQDPVQRTWFQERLERSHTSRPREDHLRILDKLSEAEVFETFLQTKYVGQTRFSLEGAESAIVILGEICEHAIDANLNEVCIAMPHRGRLNVLANVVGKAYAQIFREFENRNEGVQVISGDVMYHLGASGTYENEAGGKIAVSVAANPSHLEAVDPVVQGIARAKNDNSRAEDEYPVLPVIMHGDASFAAQGVVYETLQMSQLRPYHNGGTIHLVVNNQIGFTTGPKDARTSVYATDVAKTVQAPVIHVNGDDPDACAQAAQIAFEYRQEFGKDVIIDLLCYRRRGHNEGDDPSLTQPQMYDLIDQKSTVRSIYTKQLIGRNDITMDDAEASVKKFRSRLEEVFTEVREATSVPADDTYRLAPQYPMKPDDVKLATATTTEMMQKVAHVYQQFPEGFNVHPKVAKQLDRRVASVSNGPITWATAELLAFGTLLMEGHDVRISGQDTRRGTFNQRFGAIVDRKTNEAWVPLKHLTADQGHFDIYDSPLNEYAAMGFEYGYSVASPEALVCWEAQYGDFSNGAETIIDEFVASAFAKWTQKSGVVLLLPHGYEGAGPDHSSARIERFLQMCAGGNMAVCQPSTPASYFHLLRQHAQVDWHRPTIIFTPKSMLRNKLAVSAPEDFTSGRWLPILDDPSIEDPSAVERVLLCSGKLRWELVRKRSELGLDGTVAIVAMERFFPQPTDEFVEVLARYGSATEVRWVQDEPRNHGAWEFLKLRFEPYVAEALGRDFTLRPFTRPIMAAASTGSRKTHLSEEEDLLTAALS